METLLLTVAIGCFVILPLIAVPFIRLFHGPVDSGKDVVRGIQKRHNQEMFNLFEAYGVTPNPFADKVKTIIVCGSQIAI